MFQVLEFFNVTRNRKGFDDQIMSNKNEGVSFETVLTGIANKNWLSNQASKRIKNVSSKLVSEILRIISSTIESHKYDIKLIASIADSVNYLELYLWKYLLEDSTNDHIISIALLFVLKSTINASLWSIIDDNILRFKTVIKRSLVLTLSLSSKKAITKSDLFALKYLIFFFRFLVNNLNNHVIRTEIAPLFSIGIWTNLKHSENLVANVPSLTKGFNSFNKKFAGANQQKQSEMIIQKNWIYSFLTQVQQTLYSPNSHGLAHEDAFTLGVPAICFLIDTLSQLPTRRFVNTLIKEMNFLPVLEHFLSVKLVKNTRGYSNGLHLFEILRSMVYFPVDDFTGVSRSETDKAQLSYKALETFRSAAFLSSSPGLKDLAFAGLSDLKNKNFFFAFFQDAELEELKRLSVELFIDISQVSNNNDIIINIFYYKFIGPFLYSDVVGRAEHLLTEKDIQENYELFGNHNHKDADLALLKPLFKLGVQYLSMNDLLIRNFSLFKHESYYQVRNHVEGIVKRLDIKYSKKVDQFYKDNLVFRGFSKYSLKIRPPEILDVAPVSFSSLYPSFVKAEIQLSYYKLNQQVIQEWDSLSIGETLLLLSVTEPAKNSSNYLEKLGISYLRSATVVEVADGYRIPLGSQSQKSENHKFGSNNPKANRTRRLYVNLDPYDFKNGEQSVYKSINLVIRRRKRENNFTSILSNVLSLITENFELPNWISDLLLGYGNPQSGYYKNQINRPFTLSLSNVFQLSEHLREIFPDYQLQLSNSSGPNNESKRRKTSKFKGDNTRTIGLNSSIVIDFSEEKAKKLRIYPYNKLKYNILIENTTLDQQSWKPLIKFTRNQVEAIISGISPGLTMILGPPGTGKTDVATQIVSSVNDNFPSEKTLIVTHSNHALNHIFEKIQKLDTIEAHHLLRLGHGEQLLNLDKNSLSQSFGKLGKVENILASLRLLLDKVNRLAESLGIEGFHGNSCETAQVFFKNHILKIWQSYLAQVKVNQSPAFVAENYPFATFLEQELHIDSLSADISQLAFNDTVRKAIYYFKCIKSLFDRINSYAAFEVLKGGREKSNYMLITQAKVVAMTATHLAMRVSEFKKAGVHFDNIIIEEAGQLTVLESFLPLMLSSSASSQLKRFVLIGDYKQNTPIIQNQDLGAYSNFDLSLFKNFSQLEVPVVHLTDQGRSRATLCNLYKHVYESKNGFEIKTLPHLLKGQYELANPGLKNTYQFIDVDEKQGEIESSSNFFQNIAEAEYAVALYSYMRLLGYPRDKIVILAMYAGQTFLIEEVLKAKCGASHNSSGKNGDFSFGHPYVSTVDNYQGQESDYVILSMVRTKRLGYIKDIRRMTVALSRAKLGLYILGSVKLFQSLIDPELRKMFSNLIPFPSESSPNDSGLPNKLCVVSGEFYSNKFSRTENDFGIDSAALKEFDSVSEFSKYVYDLTMKRLGNSEQ